MAYRVSFIMDDLAWRFPQVRERRGQIFRRVLDRMRADHRVHASGQAETINVRTEREAPETRIIFEMDGFGWADRKRAKQRMQILLDALTAIHIDTLRRWPNLPPLYGSGVRYEREPPGREDWQDIHTTLRRKGGDCEDLGTWRAGELLVHGIPARAFARPRPMIVPGDEGPVVGTLWHIMVNRQGRIEDPSKKLGMEGSA